MSAPATNSAVAGFSYLATLKANALPAVDPKNTRFDVAIAQTGNAVAALFNRRCNRAFVRVVDAVSDPVPGDRTFICLPGYPLEDVSKIETLSWGESGWRDSTADFLAVADPKAGLVTFDAPWGTSFDRLRVTYTGGYMLNPDAGVAVEVPDGATPFPDDLLFAFYLQTAAEFNRRGLLGVGAVSTEGDAGEKSGGDLLPMVAEILQSYARLAS